MCVSLRERRGGGEEIETQKRERDTDRQRETETGGRKREVERAWTQPVQSTTSSREQKRKEKLANLKPFS